MKKSHLLLQSVGPKRAVRLEGLEKAIITECPSQVQEEWNNKNRSTQEEDQKANQLKPAVVVLNGRVAKGQTVQILGKRSVPSGW